MASAPWGNPLKRPRAARAPVAASLAARSARPRLHVRILCTRKMRTLEARTGTREPLCKTQPPRQLGQSGGREETTGERAHRLARSGFRCADCAWPEVAHLGRARLPGNEAVALLLRRWLGRGTRTSRDLLSGSGVSVPTGMRSSPDQNAFHQRCEQTAVGSAEFKGPRPERPLRTHCLLSSAGREMGL